MSLLHEDWGEEEGWGLGRGEWMGTSWKDVTRERDRCLFCLLREERGVHVELGSGVEMRRSVGLLTRYKE